VANPGDACAATRIRPPPSPEAARRSDAAQGSKGTQFRDLHRREPAVGESLARWILEGEAAADELTIFGVDRFFGPRSIRAPHPYPPLWH
jgi:hypothetical protein